MWNEQLSPGTILGGDFQIERFLKGGGMGDVYVAKQLSTDKRRALKIMQSHLTRDAKMRDRFKQEAKVGARISSPHVVEVIAAGIDEESGRPWLAMELLDGEDLKSYVEHHGPLSLQQAAALADQACRALGAAHQAGIVHRDLKPENLFLSLTQQTGQPFLVKILDFGIARIVADYQSQTTGTTQLGTPLWMAPEQMDSKATISPAADVWPLGLILFYVLTGRSYWREGNQQPLSLAGVMREVIIEPIAPASERAREYRCAHALPQGFDAWFARCLSREPGRRFRDASEALAQLAPILQIGAGLGPGLGLGSTGPVGAPAADPFGPPINGRTLTTLPVRVLLSLAAAAAVALAVLGGTLWAVKVWKEQQARLRADPPAPAKDKDKEKEKPQEKPQDKDKDKDKEKEKPQEKPQEKEKPQPADKKRECPRLGPLEAACEQREDHNACNRLGQLYEQGKCIKQNLCMAHSFYMQGHMGGHAASKANHQRFDSAHPGLCPDRR